MVAVIFRPELIEKIFSGEKTQTRRPAKGELRYRPGRSYGVQPGRGKKAVCRIGVHHVRRETLGDISEEDARAEGFAHSTEFFDYWSKLYGALNPEQQVWVIFFVRWEET